MVNVRPIMIVETGERFDSIKALLEHIDGDRSALYKTLNGQQKAHKGYTFAYTDGLDRPKVYVARDRRLPWPEPRLVPAPGWGPKEADYKILTVLTRDVKIRKGK